MLSITFVLHAIFFFRQALAGNFFQNHPPLPLPSSRVKWSAPNCDALIQAVLNYKCNHFLTYVKSNDFLNLDVGKVKELACLDDLHITKEEEVYEAVIEWVKHDLTSRECFLPDLLNCLRLFSLSKYSLEKFLKKEELIVKSPVCSNI